MINKPLTLILVLLMVSPILTMTNETAMTSTQATPQESAAIISETDPSKVAIEENTFPNGGLEEWNNPHQPADFSTSRSEETDIWLESTIISEGSYSFGLEARAMDTFHPVDYDFHRENQLLYTNIMNVTMDLDWYLDAIGTPVDQDYVRLVIRLDHRNMHYYLGCETPDSDYLNNAFFEIPGSPQTWNHLHRNLTTDYFAKFGELPMEVTSVVWEIRTITALEYTRVFFDDFNLRNGTILLYGGSINNADFEDTTGWSLTANSGPGDIAQCNDSHSGSSSMNLTTITFDDNAYVSAYRGVEKLLTSDNQATLSFWWKLDDYVDTTHYTYARVQVDLENATFQSNFYYYMFVGGSGTLPMIVMGNDMKFAVDNFNVTDTWNFFERNIWEDFNSVYTTENLWVDRIEFEIRSSEDDARLSMLIDDITFAPSILNDMDYEHQNAVGQPIQGWEYPSGVTDRFTVTDFAESGTKAANLTLVDANEYLNQDVHEIPFDSTKNLFLDFNVYIDTFNTTSEDFVLFQVYLDDDESFAYVIANSSSAFENEIEGEEDAKFIILQEPIVTGQWLNFRMDLDQDYETLFGSAPDTIIYDFNLIAEAVAGSELTVFFDNLYIYSDNPDTEGPVISLSPANGTTVSDIVSIEFNVTDVGSGVAWSQLLIENVSITNTTLVDVGISWETNNLANGDYNITVISQDNAGNIASVTHILTVQNAGSQPNLTGVLLIIVIIVAAGVILVIYIFVIKKK